MQQKKAPAPEQDSEELSIPEGFVVRERAGVLTGTPLFWVEREKEDASQVALNMPLCPSARDALRVFNALRMAAEAGYFGDSGARAHNARKKDAAPAGA